MKILSSNYLVTCDENFTIIENGAIVFDDKIIEIDTKENIAKKYNQEIEDLGENSVLMPGLINAHTHLEFSSNKSTLQYGNFVTWLGSVIKNRDTLIESATDKVIDNELHKMIQSGTTTIGAISSYGFDMVSCVKSPINVVYFTEALGSKADMIDTLFADFKAKLKTASGNKSKNFIPAVAIHSPYSTHPFLIREILRIAREQNFPVSAHFMESPAEKEWLNHSKGNFMDFFLNMLNQKKSLQTPVEFLNLFKNIDNLSFTHCVESNNEELELIKKLDASIIHCPNSNRLLNNSLLNLDNIKDISLAIGTDGLSSNHSLNLFEEIKNAFYMHTKYEPEPFAKQLLQAATKCGAKALGLKNKGTLEKGNDADIIALQLPDVPSQLATAIILHTNKTTHTFIGGKNETF